MKQTCSQCNGKRKELKLGGLLDTCSYCKGLGFVEYVDTKKTSSKGRAKKE